MVTWKKLREELELTEEEEKIIELEKNLILTMVRIREENGLTQAQLANLCALKQPTIARMESASHSPQLDGFLRVLVPLGYTLQIVPIKKGDR